MMYFANWAWKVLVANWPFAYISNVHLIEVDTVYFGAIPIIGQTKRISLMTDIVGGYDIKKVPARP